MKTPRLGSEDYWLNGAAGRPVVQRIAAGVAKLLEIGELSRRRARPNEAANHACDQRYGGGDQRSGRRSKMELSRDQSIAERQGAGHHRKAEAKGEHSANPRTTFPPDGQQ